MRAVKVVMMCFFFFFSSRRRHTRWTGDWSSDVCSSDLRGSELARRVRQEEVLAALEVVELPGVQGAGAHEVDRKSTRLNSSHPSISYAVFCLKKKKKNDRTKAHQREIARAHV